nr:hypothetical protein [Tanacetum cinerariifolium]
MLIQQGEGSGTPTKPHHTLSPEAQPSSHTHISSPSFPTVTTISIAPIPTVTPSETNPLMQCTRRARIAQSSALPLVADEPASPMRDVSQGEACPTESGFIGDQDRTTIAKSSTLPHDSTTRVTSPAAAQEVEINKLKETIKLLEDGKGMAAEGSGDDASIKGMRDVAAEKVSDDIEEMATVLITMDTASVLSSGGVQVVPTATTVAPANVSISTGSGVVPTASTTISTTTPIFATSTTVTPYTRRKGKEKMVKTHKPKKKKIVQEQINIQFARELEEELEREAQRMNAQIARDEEIAKIHVEEELQQMIAGLDRSNETIAKRLEEYDQVATKLTIGERIELISELVKYQDHHSKILKYQAQQRKSRTKKQKRDFYMAVIRNNLGGVSKISEGETAWLKIRSEQESAKKQKTTKEVSEEVKSYDEIPEEKIKELIRLVPIEEVYVEALQVKHTIIDWKIDREDLNQLWALEKETLGIRPATNEKEIELWVELKRPYEPDVEDHLWTHTQHIMHARVEWRGGLLGIKCTRHSHCQLQSSHCQKNFPLPKKKDATARKKRSHCQKDRTAINVKKKLPVKDGSYAKLPKNTTQSTQISKLNDLIGEIIPCSDLSSWNGPALSAKHPGSMPNHDSSITISSKIDSLFDEFAGELTLLKSIPPGFDETDCHPGKETRFAKRLLYDNPSPRPPDKIFSDNSNADIESFSPSPIPNLDSDPLMEEIDLSFNPNDPMPPGIEEDDDDSERDVPIFEELLDNYSLSLPKNKSYHFNIPSPSRPPTKPPDGNTGTLNIKMMGDVSDQKVPMPNLMITLVLNQEESPDLLSHLGLEIFQPSAE